MFITTHTEGEIRGRLVRIAPEAIVVASERGERTVAFSDVGWIEKRGDPVWNGAVIGAFILGYGMGGGAGASCSPNCSREVPEALAMGFAIGAAVGALIDWMIPGRALVYGKRADKRQAVPARPVATAPPQSRSALASLWSRVAPGDRITRTAQRAERKSTGASHAPPMQSVTVDVGQRTPGDFRERGDGSPSVSRRHACQEGPVDRHTAVGALSGTNACYGNLDEPYQQHDSGMPCGVGVLLGAAGGGAVGALLGRMTWGSTVVYTVAPVASAHSVGVIASFAF